MQYEYSSIKIPGYNVETWYIGNIVTLPGQYGSAQKFATLAGGYYPLYYGVIAPGDHWILIRCAKHHPTRSVPPNQLGRNFGAFVGVVRPTAHRNFCGSDLTA